MFNINKFKEKKLFLKIALICNVFLLIVYLYLVSKFNLDNNDLVNFTVPRNYYYLISFFLFTLILLIYIMFKRTSLYIIVVIFGVLITFLTRYYSPIDESTHFYYIIYMIKYHKIPTLWTSIDSGILGSITELNVPGGYLNEAFQPPLYYFIGAIIYLLVPAGLKVKFFVLRLFGVFCIIISIIFTVKTYKYLVNKKIIKENDFLFYSLILLLSITPGFLLRMITISNEHLIVPLASIFTYLLIVYYYSDTLNSKLHVFILALLTSSLFLTKIYGGVVGAVVVAILLMKKHYKSIILYIIEAGAMVSPWFAFNLLVYGHLTSNQQTNELVSKMTDAKPINIDLAFIMDKLNAFFGTFWHPQEFYSAIGEFNMMNTSFLNIIFICAIIFSIFYLVPRYRTIKENENITIFIVSSQIVLAICFIIFGSMFNHADAFIGRYIFFTYTAIIILLYIFISKIFKEKYILNLAVVIIFITIFLFNNFFVYTLSNRSRDFFLLSKITTKLVDIGLSPYSNDKYVDLNGKFDISQTFSSNSNGLSGIRLFISSSEKEIMKPYILLLKDESNGEIVRKVNLDSKNIKATGFYSLTFDKIKNSKGKTYSFSIVEDSKIEDNFIKLKLSQSNVYTLGKLYINKGEQEEDLVFKLIYSR